MDKEEMMKRTAHFGLRVVNLCLALEQEGSMSARVLGKQLLRCATSIGANYRAACHAGNRADFLAKLKICEQEADECEYWLELLVQADLVSEVKVRNLRAEAHELACIIAAAAKATRTTAPSS